MAITVRPIRSDEGRLFLEIHGRSIRGLAVHHYSPNVIDAWAMPATDDNVSRLLTNPENEIRLLAILDGEPVGLGSLAVAHSELRACYVVPEAARCGVGSALVREIERLAREHGISEISLTASLNAEPFYRELGYEVVEPAEHRLGSGDWMSAVKMRRRLSPERARPDHPIPTVVNAGSAIAALTHGTEINDRTGLPVRYRLLTLDDDLSVLTALLNEAYAPLAAAGMRFVASYQNVETTRVRTEKGLPFVALLDGEIVGTLTVASIANTNGSSFYDRPDVASVGQFAVAPALQRRGIGSTMIRLAERCAAEMGAAHLALDTSEHAGHLIAFYEARGYTFIEHLRWPDVNYRSVVMAKPLTRAELPRARTHD